MSKLHIALIALVTAVLVSGVGVAILAPKAAQKAVNAAKDNLGALTSPDISSPYLKWGEVGRHITPLSCASATSTMFAIQNPWQATSTATLLSFYGVANATSTTFEIGTSTTATGLTAATVSNHLIDGALVATSTQFYVSSGVTIGPDSSHVLPGTLSKRTIMVGPSQYVSGFATSTYGDNGAINYSGSFSNCVGYIEWIR